MLPSDTSAAEATYPLRRFRTDRRQAERYVLPVAVGATLDGPGRRASVLLVNVSLDGIGLLTRDAIACGTLVTIALLPTPRWPAGMQLAARVTHCTAQADGEWYVGCVACEEAVLAQLLPRLLVLGRNAEAGVQPEPSGGAPASNP